MPTCNSDSVPLWIDRQEGGLLEGVLLIGTRDRGRYIRQNPVGIKGRGWGFSAAGGIGGRTHSIYKA